MIVTPRNNIHILPFDRNTFLRKIIPNLLKINEKYWHPSNQLQYLCNYLGQIKARTLLFEEHYIDRHFMEEYNLYYAKCLGQRSNSCSRLHVFSANLTESDFHLAIQTPGSKFERKVIDSYQGFMVFRPVQPALIGRTVLIPLSDDPNRYFDTVIHYRTHLAGIELSIRGIAFQQQDQRVGACATTAIWTALQRVSRFDGERAPTPAKITELAVRYFLPAGRAYPSEGLTIEQISEAIRGLGYAPHVLKPKYPEIAKIILVTYLKSGIPIILIIKSLDKPDINHAVVAVGYNFNSHANSFFRDLRTPAFQLEKIYIHDDRIGPYARAAIAIKEDKLFLEIPFDWSNGSVEHWEITHFIIPLYPKLRTSAEELLGVGSTWIDALSCSLNLSSDRFSFDLYFDRSGEVLKNLRHNSSICGNSKIELLKQMALSRYVGVFLIKLDGEPFIQMFWDTTDRLQIDPNNITSLSAVLCENQKYNSNIKAIFNDIEVLVV